MKKAELITTVAEQCGVAKTVTEKVLDSFVETVKDELAQSGKVFMMGFGTFEVIERPARSGRNPKTGETIELAPSKSPKFKASKALKKAVNQERG